MVRRIAAILIGITAVFGLAGAHDGDSYPGVTLIGIDHNGGAADLNSGPIVANVGDSVTVSLVADVMDGESLGSWTIDLRYESLVVDAVSCVAEPGSVCNADFTAVDARVSGSSVAGLSGMVNLMSVTFDVVGPAGHCTELHAEPDALTNPSLVDLESIHPTGEVCVTGEVGELGIDHDGGAADINAGPLEIEAGASGAAGLVFQVPDLGLKAWTVDVTYDPAVLDGTACVSHPSGVCNADFNSMQVRSVGADLDELTGTQQLANFTFQAIGSPGDCSALTITVELLVTSRGNTGEEAYIEYNPTIFNGQICVTEAPVPCADVTGDGRVRWNDAVRILLRAIFGPYDPRFDLNGDGVINGDDVRIAVNQLGTSC